MKIKRYIIFAIVFVIAVFSTVGCENESGKRNFYEINAVYSDQGYLQVSMTVTACADIDGQDYMYFNLYPNAYREGAKITPLKDGDSAGDFLLSSVKVNGQKAEYTIEGADENLLKVALDKEYTNEQNFSVGLNYTIKLSESDERLSFGEGRANLGNFFPMLCVYDNGEPVVCEFGAIGDPFVSECSDYTVRLTVGGEYVVASGFEAQSLDMNDDKTTYIYTAENVRDVAFAINKNYEVKEQKSADKSIKYYFYNDEKSETTIKAIGEAIEFFSSKFGEYPYSAFATAQTSFDAGGMEYPCLTFVADNLSYEDYLVAVVHEAAHQWWYGVVGNDQIKEPYLDESLAEYSTYVFFAEHPGYGVDAEKFCKEKKEGCAYAEHAFMSVYGDFSGKVNRNLKEFINNYDYVNSVYNKGFLMMKAAEDAVGRATLLNYLKNYCKANKFKIADTSAFLKAMGRAEPVISSYLDGRVLLPLT